jgi:hypothetical protein
MIMLWICIIIGIVVFGAMGYAMYKFRHSKGAVPDTKFTHSTVLEAIWTIIRSSSWSAPQSRPRAWSSPSTTPTTTPLRPR